MSTNKHFPTSHFGMLSRHGQRPSSHGPVTKINQDRACVMVHPTIPNADYFAVFDGHGHRGDLISHAVMCSVTQSLSVQNLLEDPKAALRTAFAAGEQRLWDQFESTAAKSGSTGNVVVRVGGSLLCANLGDSRAVLALQCLPTNGSRSSMSVRPDRGVLRTQTSSPSSAMRSSSGF